VYIYTREERFGKNDIDLFLNGLFSCITKIRGILGAGSEINMILHHIIFEKITDDYFFENFQIILLMFGFDFILDENTLKTNNKFALATKKPGEIFELFNREIKSENASRKIRLIV